MKQLLREPLLHFLILGAALFAAYGWLNGGLPDTGSEIVVSRGQMHSLQAQFERVWQRTPTPGELQGLVDNWVREEIFYREGVVMGLDRDDPVVRRRIAQKVEFIVDGATPAAPTPAQLQSWLDAHPEKYAIGASYSLRQIYFDPTRHGESTETTISTVRTTLEKGGSTVGDSTMLPATLQGSASELARIFGSDFERALRALPIGGWQGPVRSGFGLHLVQLSFREDGRQARLDEVRESVERDLVHARAEEEAAVFYARLRSNYSVRVEGAAADAEPSG
ncbi:peptidyl-prolyl cis-trans isomerase [Povalibacter sp.]|uniref:peptidyl-prolyl cis-trans isomerase n=1 Tax=Povalibacter sp. TaxID=1962978 RepID=UPI002F40E0A5